MLLDAPMDGEGFLAWVEQMLAPTLRPGDIVVMDNLAAHKVVGVRQAIEAGGAELRYLSPDGPVSIRSKMPSPSSRRTCESQLRVPSTHLTEPPPMRRHSSSLTNARTYSHTQDTNRIKRNPL
jgi:hypothetical protein